MVGFSIDLYRQITINLHWKMTPLKVFAFASKANGQTF